MGTENNGFDEPKTKKRKSVVVPFRVPVDELEEFDELATQNGRTRSDFLRESMRRKLVRKRRMPDREALLDAAAAIMGVGRNYNQLTRYSHEEGRLPAARMDEMAQLLDQLLPLARDLKSLAIDGALAIEAEATPPDDYRD